MNTAHPLPIRYLPTGLRTIAEMCGWEIMWKLWDAYPGGRICVPEKAAADHPLAEVLGMADLAIFCRAMRSNGGTINIPKADAAKRAVRDKAIRAEKAAGAPMNDLCRKYKLTYRQIQSITREDTNSSPALNFDLFDS